MATISIIVIAAFIGLAVFGFLVMGSGQIHRSCIIENVAGSIGCLQATTMWLHHMNVFKSFSTAVVGSMNIFLIFIFVAFAFALFFFESPLYRIARLRFSFLLTRARHYLYTHNYYHARHSIFWCALRERGDMPA
ncbi:MAG: hypothetical protein HYW78_00195 [Parcubacteria group bacterium]|nr:hypothetical protein [Parcubacteria group bacterium]